MILASANDIHVGMTGTILSSQNYTKKLIDIYILVSNYDN
jgi:hypothetical protein